MFGEKEVKCAQPPEVEPILDRFYAYEHGEFAIKQNRWKMFVSYDRDGNELVTALQYGFCLSHTMTYLRWKKEGYIAPEGEDVRTYSSFVGGKL